MDKLSPEVIEDIRTLSLEEVVEYWDEYEKVGRKKKKIREVVRVLCQADLFYLLVRVCGRVDMLCDFAFERCREVERSPDGHLDLWAREHFKSSIITFGKTIQDILNDPEMTFGIFSHTRPKLRLFSGRS